MKVKELGTFLVCVCLTRQFEIVEQKSRVLGMGMLARWLGGISVKKTLASTTSFCLRTHTSVGMRSEHTV